MLSREKLPPIKNPKLNHYHSCLSLVYLVPHLLINVMSIFSMGVCLARFFQGFWVDVFFLVKEGPGII